MLNLLDFFTSSKVTQPQSFYGYNDKIYPNAGNFQEYTYELEWMECYWNQVYQITDLVTAYWYPWLRKDS